MDDPDPPPDRLRPRSSAAAAAAASSAAGSSSNPPDTFLKRQLDAANKEKADLQSRVRHLDSQNMALLKSLFEVSAAAPGRVPPKPLPVDILTALRQLSVAAEHPKPPAGKGSAYRRSAPDRRPSNTPGPDTGVQPRVSAAYAPFRARADLVGHASAVYAVQFSPNGALLVSASFDRSLRLWPVTRLLDRRAADDRACIPDAHHAPVTAVEWAFDSARVITGGLDQSAAEWDVLAVAREPIVRFPVDGLVNAVSVSPANDNLFFVATSRRAVHMFDRRVPPPAVNTSAPSMSGFLSSAPARAAVGGDVRRSVIVDNDASVNTVHVTLDGNRFITGDHAGLIKTWELRGGRGGGGGSGSSSSGGGGGPSDARAMHGASQEVGLLDSTPNDDACRPITHIHTAPPLSGEEHGRFMAVNSYDSFLRVYDRGTCLIRGASPVVLAPVQAFRGVIGAHWPIKSSFFLGADYRPATGASARAARRAARRRRRSVRGRASESRSSVRSEPTGADVDGDDGNAASGRDSAVSDSSDGDSGSDDDDGSGDGDDDAVDSGGSSGDGSGDAARRGRARSRSRRGRNGDGSGGGGGGGGGGGSSGGGGDAGRRRGTSAGQGGGGGGAGGAGDGEGSVKRGEEFGETIGGAVQKSLILASGSADGRVYVFDVAARAGRGGLLQTLDGHRDRVYAVDFHPTEPLFASCSADTHIKIWQSQPR